MRTLLIAIVLYCCAVPAFADDVATGDTEMHPIGAVVNAVEKMDAWIQQNLW